jgi:lipid A 4'-phosphatase
MINKTPLDATSLNPRVDLQPEQRDWPVLSQALGGREWVSRFPQYSILSRAPNLLQRFRSELKKPWVHWFLGIHGLLGLTFFLLPEIDLGFSGLFYTAGKGFVIGSRSSARALPFLPWVTIAFVNLSVLLFIRNIIDRRRNRQSISRLASIRRILFLLLTLALGPGLLINTYLKEQSGRSRPSRVEAFGGDRQFTAAFAPSGPCKSNCSFVSGDAAMGYYLLAFVFIARKRRWAIALTGYTLGTAFGLVRIAQGAHFLSDVIFAGFFTFLVAWILSLLLLPAQENSAAPLVPSLDRQ